MYIDMLQKLQKKCVKELSQLKFYLATIHYKSYLVTLQHVE